MGRTIGRYELLREIGHGAMARVHLARHLELDRLVALKELRAFHSDDPSIVRRFLRESRLAGSLNHPGIVTVHDFFEHAGTPYIAMEYVERGSLRPWIGAMTLGQMGAVLESLLAALEYVAERDVIHRDLKPENVMVTRDGTIKIADFGIAKAKMVASSVASLTAPGKTLGTPAYMAPEQATGEPIGAWTDLYAVGVMAWEMVVGDVPFHDAKTPVAVLFSKVNEQIPPARALEPRLPEPLSDWIDRMVSRDRERRPAGAAAAWDALEPLLVAQLGARWRDRGALPETPSTRRRGPGLATPAADRPPPAARAAGTPADAAETSDVPGASEEEDAPTVARPRPDTAAAPPAVAQSATDDDHAAGRPPGAPADPDRTVVRPAPEPTDPDRTAQRPAAAPADPDRTVVRPAPEPTDGDPTVMRPRPPDRAAAEPTVQRPRPTGAPPEASQPPAVRVREPAGVHSWPPAQTPWAPAPRSGRTPPTLKPAVLVAGAVLLLAVLAAVIVVAAG